jgi:hypothetical protein
LAGPENKPISKPAEQSRATAGWKPGRRETLEQVRHLPPPPQNANPSPLPSAKPSSPPPRRWRRRALVARRPAFAKISSGLRCRTQPPRKLRKRPAPANKDPLGKVPMQRDDGTPATSTRNSQKSYRHRPRPLPPAEIEQAAATGKKNDPLRSLGHPNCREFREPYHTASRDCARRPSQVR